MKLRLLIGIPLFLLGCVAIGALASDTPTAVLLGMMNGAFLSHFVFRGHR